MAKDVWDTVALCERQFEVWKKTLWNDIDTDIMEDASKAFVKEVWLDLPVSYVLFSLVAEFHRAFQRLGPC